MRIYIANSNAIGNKDNAADDPEPNPVQTAGICASSLGSLKVDAHMVLDAAANNMPITWFHADVDLPKATSALLFTKRLLRFASIPSCIR